MAKKTKRQAAIIRRRIFLASICALLALAIAILTLVISLISNADKDNSQSSSQPSSSQTDSAASGDNTSKEDKPQTDSSVIKPSSSTASASEPNSRPSGLDANYTNLLLVNADNPLPDDYDANVRKDLVEIDPKYRNNNYVTQIHKDVYPYITAMVAAAQADGVDLRVWSPFRSYAIQKDLFQKQVNRVGGDEALAATVVARPGTSEHNTGLCADFNMASDAFENTKMYTWMTENAEDYGFIMRYRKDKQPITGVIHESWHWRFVGINAAKEMNSLDMCLEEYVNYKKNKR